MTTKLKELRRAMRRRMHAPVRKQQTWLNSVLRGHYACYGITGSSRSIDRFRTAVLRAWRYVLMRRGNRNRLYLARFNALVLRFPLTPARIVHVWRYPQGTSGDPSEEPDAGKPHVRICEGSPGDRRLYSTNSTTAAR